MPQTFADILKFNPYHDSRGRFASASGAASFTYAPGKSTAHDAAIQRGRESDQESTAKGFKGTLYHGSPETDIEEFDMDRAGSNTSSGEKLIYFTDSKQLAEDFSYERLEGSSKYFQRRGKKGRVYEVDVEMKNPLDLRNLSDKDIDNILNLDVDGILTKDMVKMYAQKNHQLLKSGLELTAESLKSLGYDGLIANTGKAGHNSLEYAVVDSKQAKIIKAAPIAKTFDEFLKHNPYHDAKGRFTTAASGGGVVPTVKRESVLSAIRELPACNDIGEPIEHSGEGLSEMCINPIPFAGDKTSDEVFDLIEKYKDDGFNPWDDAHSELRSVRISSIKSNQPAISRLNMVMIMNEGLSDVEFDQEVCIVKYKNQYILQDGNHRTALAKLSGRTSVTARVFDEDKQRVKKSSDEDLEKFNPYHDSRGRFASAGSATSFTIRTKDPSKQHLADAAAARERERDAAGGAAPAEEKETPRMQSIHNVEDRIRSQNYESAAIIDKDGNELLFKDGSRSQVGFTPMECAMMKDNTLTHNHPRSSMFSDEDIKCFVKNEMEEIRATTREGMTFSVKRGEGYSKADGQVFLLEYQINSGLARATAQSELDARGFAEKIMRGEMSHTEANKEFGKVVTRELTTFCENKAPEYNLEFTVETRNVSKSAGTEEYVAKAAGDGDNSIVLDQETEDLNDAAFNEWLAKNNIPREETTEKSATKSVLFVGLQISGADSLAIDDGEDPKDFHVTLAYGHFDQTGNDDSIDEKVQAAIEDIRDLIPDDIHFDAIGRFEASESSDGKDVIYAQVAAGQLEKAHDGLLKSLKERGIILEATFPTYKPHMTLAYIDSDQEYELSKIDAAGTATKVTIGHGKESSHEKQYTIMKTDDDKRLVFGWASVSFTVDGEQLEDLQHDMIDPDDLEEAAYEYVLNFRDTGELHNPNLRKKGKLVESCVFTAEKQKAMGIPEGTLPIGWWIGFKIEDDDAWEKVKKGIYKMFSIEGKANRVPVEKAAPAEDPGRFVYIEEFP